MDMTYDEFIRTVPNNQAYKDTQFLALKLKKSGIFGKEELDLPNSDVGTYKSMDPVPEGVKICFSRRSVIVPTDLLNPDSNVKIFRHLENISIASNVNPMVSGVGSTAPTKRQVIGKVPDSRKGGRKSRRRSNKKKSTRRRKY